MLTDMLRLIARVVYVSMESSLSFVLMIDELMMMMLDEWIMVMMIVYDDGILMGWLIVMIIMRWSIIWISKINASHMIFEYYILYVYDGVCLCFNY